jgi:hypothetical protein
MIYVNVLYGASRHPRIESIFRVLNYRHTTTLLYSPQPGGTIVKVARQYHGLHARAIASRRRAEERINSRAVTVLFRPMHHPNIAILDYQVAIRLGYIDTSVLDGLAVSRVGHG